MSRKRFEIIGTSFLEKNPVDLTGLKEVAQITWCHSTFSSRKRPVQTWKYINIVNKQKTYMT